MGCRKCVRRKAEGSWVTTTCQYCTRYLPALFFLEKLPLSSLKPMDDRLVRFACMQLVAAEVMYPGPIPSYLRQRLATRTSFHALASITDPLLVGLEAGTRGHSRPSRHFRGRTYQGPAHWRWITLAQSAITFAFNASQMFRTEPGQKSPQIQVMLHRKVTVARHPPVQWRLPHHTVLRRMAFRQTAHNARTKRREDGAPHVA